MSALLHPIVNVALLTMLVLLALGIALRRDLFSAAIYAGAFSMTMATLFLLLDAPDVAFTEAAIGASLTLILFLAAMTRAMGSEKIAAPRRLTPILVSLLTGAFILYGAQDLPPHASPDAPIHLHVAPDYLARTQEEFGFPNVVTAILASYRGFDTLGEVYVIFTAGVAILALLGGAGTAGARRRKP